MGFFKDLNDLKKTGKEIEKEKFGTTNPFKIMKQGVSQAKEGGRSGIRPTRRRPSA